MEEKEKQDLLKIIAAMRLEAKEELRMISYLANEIGILDNKEVDKWLDRLNYLDKLEEEIRKHQ